MTGDGAKSKGTFPVQAELRQPWRKFVEDLAPHRPLLLRFCRGLAGNLWDGEGDGGIARLRLYCFSPDVIATLASEFGVSALPRPYLSPG